MNNNYRYILREKMKQRISELRKQYPYKTNNKLNGQIRLSNYSSPLTA
ncbi:MAG: hypothetical protein KAS12_03315 [Candidatus Aenigmarchaeota archaeon]|nr:hypothetical protein [Candidatus Aenigmarchaeota archaeon]